MQRSVESLGRRRMIIVLDIETVRHPLVPVPDADDEEGRCPAAPHHQIVAAAGIVLEPHGDRESHPHAYEATRAVTFGGEGDPDERRIVEHVARALKKATRVIGWNSSGFDLRVIHAACLEHGIQCGWLSRRDVSYRFTTDGHDDVMDRFSSFGAGQRGKQEAYARRSGLPGKMGVDGSQVAALAKAGKWSDIRAYNGQDVGQLSGVWLRDEFVGERLTLAGYRTSAASLVSLFEKTPGLRPIVEHERFDRKKFLLEEV
jgi:DNA polymerase elongation subunit (family B)